MSNFEVAVPNKSNMNCLGCSCQRKNVPISESDKIGDMIKKILSSKPQGKATIKLDIQFDN